MRIPADSFNTTHDVGSLNGQWVSHVSFGWFLIFVASSLGFAKFRNIMTIISTIFGTMCLLPTVAILLIESVRYSVPIILYSDFATLTNCDFWIDILVHSFSVEIPGNFVLLGSISPKIMVPTEDVFTIYILKIIFLLIILTWVSVGVQRVQRHYKIRFSTCVPIDGMSLLFALIPDMLTRGPLPSIPLFLWFSGIWFHGLTSAIYTVTAFLDSFVQLFPVIGGIRAWFSAIFCTVCFFFNMIILTSNYFAMEEFWHEVTYTNITILVSLLFSIAIFVYSCDTIIHDFQFTYGKLLTNYWINCLKLIVLLTMISFFLIISQTLSYQYRYRSTTIIIILGYCFLITAILPIIIVAIWNYLKYKNQGKVILAVTPTEEWGPPSKEEKEACKRFQPAKEFHFRTEDLKCTHNCLLKSGKLRNEIRRLAKNQVRLVKINEPEETIT